ncbi:MAG TPA: ABC transporter permease [Solirubrobacteraceae bacterium]|jgi:peptide/nickel transport system permease protein|nr:ABC transporter permease [Solirubrobacteraceae bacterium]
MSIVSEVAFEEQPVQPAGGDDLPPGVGVWQLAWKRLRRNRVAMFFGFLFLVIVVMCLLAPVYSQDVAHVGPNFGNITATVNEGGKTVFVVSDTAIPIGPTWQISHYFLGADDLGRDVAVRLLYGGRDSLEIGVVATLITMFFGVLLGTIAGFFRGFIDALISRVMDVIWSYPAVLLGITLGTVVNIRGFLFLHSTTVLTTALVVGFVYIPYVVRPVRAQVLTLREREFIDAARQQGLGNLRIMFGEMLPNLSSTIVIFIPLILANAIILEAALSYLGAGVQAPNASWGTMIQAGLNDFPQAFHEVLVPGIMLVIAVMSVNIFGDGLRDALDPRSKVSV